MIAPKFMPVVVKQLWRHRVRSVLTLSGVAIAMFLFIAVQTLQEGVRHSTQAAAGDTTLVVYRENRFCPAASRLPQFYVDRIEKISGVVSAVPVKIVVNNCRASLDVVTFRGVPREELVGPGAGRASGNSSPARSLSGRSAPTRPSWARHSPRGAASRSGSPSTPRASP
jgi:hypothetical protein